ncbi:MAG TPA: N,N-dimethylformamidase beta subunit family domain-containing protein [Hypericibacter adhaerens]|uniref:N,N-dimethylformamidase beta subunit family domain-containing protein n=1 Tax=Hypericibacter adhaerens TaxID=2602016 RepID=UPI002B97B22D|nr:N,N-dimethylformamidase beta subunit family domain-containing protein [Hypericibacter adhaerens]HWA44699.1 N,N-dimethylformamidase beta subunit family domain-containing protein [Hypericibacter adhaerens]
MIEILGYADRLAVRPGMTIAFKVSCETGAARYRADIVRLRCGDDRPDGPGFREEPVADAAANGDYPGRRQAIDCGSYVRVGPAAAFDAVDSFTLSALIWPTLPGLDEATVIGRWSGPAETGFGYALAIDGASRPCLRLGDGVRVWRLVHPVALAARRWYRLLASFDSATGAASLHCEPVTPQWGDPVFRPTAGRCPLRPLSSGPRIADVPVAVAAHVVEGGQGTWRGAGHFNGKIEAPRLHAQALPAEQIGQILSTPLTGPSAASLVAAWDFSRDIPGTKARDIGPNGLDGDCINLPTRAMTGHAWTAEAMNWTNRPHEYAAIHFHEDDLYDCAWETDFRWTIPPDLKSGIYAARLRCGNQGEDHVPFFVLPPRGHARAPVAFLASTATYLAYANSHDHYEDPVAERCHGLTVLAPADLFLMQRRDLGLSAYDHHRDGSGSCWSSRLRPILNLRPKRALWSLNADLHLTDWLEAIGQEYDVIDDETLHREGVSLLERYACVMTGTHPEYYSTAMLTAMAAYLERGGRLMYLGGNGFYWRVAWHDELPGAMEIRRGEAGTRMWTSEPGETGLATTGEPSGMWRHSGFAPQRLVGVGFISEGFDSGSYYRRLPDSYDPRAGFIFAGVDEEILGDFGVFGGAAALELDIVNPKVGTPPHALLLASSEGHSNVYVIAQAETGANHPGMDGIESPLVRADMVFFETLKGGAVFSTGSIGWAGSLAHDNYRNNISRITENVLRRFISPEPFPSSAGTR